MMTHVYGTKRETSEHAADQAENILIDAIQENGEAHFMVATGASQFDFLKALTAKDSIDWSKTTMFHLDEYIGISADHPASFRKYLRERFLDEVDPGTVHFIQGNAKNPEAECNRLNEIIEGVELDVSFVGIGENGHLAFNDPPADFETKNPYIIVDMDQQSRKQQVDEGWFDSISDVPQLAISASVHQIMESKNIICTIPGERKAKAVKACFEGEISPKFPASILREHDDTDVYLDYESTSLLEERKN